MGFTVIPTLALISWALFSIEEIGHTIGAMMSPLLRYHHRTLLSLVEKLYCLLFLINYHNRLQWDVPCTQYEVIRVDFQCALRLILTIIVFLIHFALFPQIFR